MHDRTEGWGREAIMINVPLMATTKNPEPGLIQVGPPGLVNRSFMDENLCRKISDEFRRINQTDDVIGCKSHHPIVNVEEQEAE